MLQIAVAAALVAVLAGLAQAVTGFGFAMVSIPLLALWSDSRLAIVAITMLAAFLTLVAGIRERRHVQWRTMRLVTVAGVVGMPVGLLALKLASVRTLSLLIGGMVLVSVVILARGLRLEPRTSSTLAAGWLSGALLTSTGMNGPPLVATFQAMRLTPHTFRATLQAAFFVQDMFAIAGFVIIGQLSTHALVAAAAGVPGVLVGWFLGDRVFRLISPRLFRWLVLLLMTATGCVALAQAA
ncbi:sulfite exporter TauE/SafE family protein [Segeticoccus rhizosphaerae]|jgi:uncharacterized membrane protein YfcA|uniref:sulfite exporter TauE/SafE family protein n=1 Tax=Segeticoccus rhizosphaerae TaxID=1104777 RepID=UPI0010C0A7C3|nr:MULTISPECIES: sulfite exporter TauE/SafE family protein [Intrasporangiaceae]